MKIAVYGDSWLWQWYYDGSAVAMYPTSKELTQNLFSDFDTSIPIMKILLNHMGHTLENNCKPGRSFTQTTDVVEQTPVTSDISLVFYSCDLRGFEAAKFVLENNQSLEQFCSAWDKVTIDNLTKVRNHADKHQQHTMIAAGQGTLMPGIFESVPESKYFHLLSPCILSDIWLGPIGHGHGGTDLLRFKLCDFVSDNPDLEQYHPEIIDILHHDLESWKERILPYSTIDGGHLDGNSVILFLNMLFSYIERINNARNIIL